VALTSQSADTQCRQRVVDEYRNASKETIRYDQAVACDRHVLAEVRFGRSKQTVNASMVQTETTTAQQQVVHLIGNVNQISLILSRNLHPIHDHRAGHNAYRESARFAVDFSSIRSDPSDGASSDHHHLPPHNRIREEDAAEESVRADLARAT
jgi:hypothetical protein